MKKVYKVNRITGEETYCGKIYNKEIKNIFQDYKFDEDLKIYYNENYDCVFYVTN